MRLMRRMGGAGRVTAATAIVTVVAFTGSALASANRIKLAPPTHAVAGASYSITAKGYAAHSERLYVFIDYYKCGASPTVEDSHGAPGVYWTVLHKFKKKSSWKSHTKGSDHACGYLVSTKTGKVLAHKFGTYIIH